MLRIYGNRPLKTLSGQTTRPTPARVREAVFNIWQNSIQDCRWLDLCAGCGAMGAEALCRGAAEVVGVEQSAAACRVIRENWQRVATAEQHHAVIKGNVVRQLTRFRGQQFDHIYFDPPYAGGLYEAVLSAIASLHLLTSEGELAVEYTPDEWTPGSIEGLELIREKHYGKTHLAFYTPATNYPDAC
jgi:16S rRNA (guanine(966)-N(2))-methyltransferase RsmD